MKKLSEMKQGDQTHRVLDVRELQRMFDRRQKEDLPRMRAQRRLSEYGCYVGDRVSRGGDFKCSFMRQEICQARRLCCFPEHAVTGSRISEAL